VSVGGDPDAFADLMARVRACRHCRDAPAIAPLPHEPRAVVRGQPTARLLIASQAPGTRVHASGLPFDDPSGDRLRAWMGVDRATFYDDHWLATVPMGFCFPGQDAKGGDLPPRPECAPRWRAEVLGAFSQVDLILLVGQHAQRWHLGDGAAGGLTETVRRWRAIHDPTADPRLVPLPHPSWRNTAWLKANPWFEAEVLPVLRAEVAASRAAFLSRTS
jgi:uracil-DNA glycosylase